MPGRSTNPIASEGQPVAQTPQPIQRSKSTIGNSSSATVTASAGHRSPHVPHPVHRSASHAGINPELRAMPGLGWARVVFNIMQWQEQQLQRKSISCRITVA